ncbi:MAG: ankyrin repeat domain-containing protein [Acidobacteriota bacterium]
MSEQLDRVIDAAKNGRVDEVSSLLDADPTLATAATMAGAQLIHAAYFAGQTAVIELLFQRGVTLDPYLAADLGMLDKVKAATEADPDFPGEFGPNGFTALHRACYWGQADVARFLLDEGTDPNAITQDKFLQIAPLGCAVATADVPNPSDDEDAVLELVQLLVERGAKVNARRRDGLTALHSAAFRGHLKVIRYLLDHGADPAMRGYDALGSSHSGKLPADFAAAHGHTNAVEMLKAKA